MVGVDELDDAEESSSGALGGGDPGGDPGDAGEACDGVGSKALHCITARVRFLLFEATHWDVALTAASRAVTLSLSRSI